MRTKNEEVKAIKDMFTVTGLIKYGDTTVFLSNGKVKIKRQDDRKPWSITNIPAHEVREVRFNIEQILNNK